MGLLEKQYQHVRKLVETPFQQGWDFRVEFVIPTSNPASSKIPANFDVYVKGINHGGFTIDYESKKIGAGNINSVVSKSAGSVRMTMRDNKSGEVETLLRALAKSVINDDMTVNLPSEYMFKVKLYRPDNNDNEFMAHEWKVSAEEMGELDRSHDKVTDNLSFEVAFKKYRS